MPLLLTLTLPVGACVGGAGSPIRQEERVVLGCELLPTGAGSMACERATTALAWRGLRQRVGGAVGQLPSTYANLSFEAIVVVPLPPARGIAQVLVGSDEDVDVVTLVLVDDPAVLGPRAAVLRLAERPNPLAVVLREAEPPAERVAATFPAR